MVKITCSQKQRLERYLCRHIAWGQIAKIYFGKLPSVALSQVGTELMANGGDGHFFRMPAGANQGRAVRFDDRNKTGSGSLRPYTSFLSFYEQQSPLVRALAGTYEGRNNARTFSVSSSNVHPCGFGRLHAVLSLIECRDRHDPAAFPHYRVLNISRLFQAVRSTSFGSSAW